jgi:hypothetical protein
MPNTDSNSKVSLEELLRLKRAERPSQEFWVKFEQEMRQKQLTALVRKRRWWHDMSLLLNRRTYMPAGATALVAIGLVSVRFLTPTPIAEVQNRLPQIAASEPLVEMLPATVVRGAPRNELSRHAEPVVADAPVAQPEIADSPPVQPAAHEKISPSARSIAANLARLEQSEPDLVNSVMGNRLSLPARVQSVASIQPEPESDSQKYRLIARYAERALSPEPVAPASVRERIARRLGDDLGDDISRIGVKGSRVSLKF